MKKLLSLALAASCLFAGTLAAAPVKYSQRETFDYGWRFAQVGE